MDRSAEVRAFVAARVRPCRERRTRSPATGTRRRTSSRRPTWRWCGAGRASSAATPSPMHAGSCTAGSSTASGDVGSPSWPSDSLVEVADRDHEASTRSTASADRCPGAAHAEAASLPRAAVLRRPDRGADRSGTRGQHEHGEVADPRGAAAAAGAVALGRGRVPRRARGGGGMTSSLREALDAQVRRDPGAGGPRRRARARRTHPAPSSRHGRGRVGTGGCRSAGVGRGCRITIAPTARPSCRPRAARR